ncbi:hypothetical protein LJC28_03160 [Dysgonomonas sp. OttesenSCG-928-D17]|nr:hypothetical protein [Dysgonomonas sp. OttesenSCG-928-D17]
MILIGESSSSKTEWCITSRFENEIIEHCITDGINPYLQTRKQISHVIRLQLPPEFFKIKCSTIYFYSAGCANDEKKDIVKASLESQFRTPSVIESDLVGAARALFGNEAGIACILGTGSNSCFYDGEKVVKNVKPLGFILGDEGSSASMGKFFLSDCLKGIAPKELIEPFYDLYKIDENEILNFIYNQQSPQKLLHTFSYFLSEHLEHEYIYNLVKNSMKSFFERNVLQYDAADYPIRFVGAVAVMYSSILRDVAAEYGLKVDQIVGKSMKGLMEYHKNVM